MQPDLDLQCRRKVFEWLISLRNPSRQLHLTDSHTDRHRQKDKDERQTERQEDGETERRTDRQKDRRTLPMQSCGERENRSRITRLLLDGCQESNFIVFLEQHQCFTYHTVWELQVSFGICKCLFKISNP